MRGLPVRPSRWSCTGIDIDQERLEAARTRCAKLGLENVHLEEGDIRTIEMEPESFDLVFIRHLLEHMRDPLSIVQRARTVLKPGGSIAIQATDWSGIYGYPPLPALD